MSKPVIKYVERFDGRCGLTIETPAQVFREQGTDNVKLIRRATQKDLEHIKAMGGYVPSGKVLRGPP